MAAQVFERAGFPVRLRVLRPVELADEGGGFARTFELVGVDWGRWKSSSTAETERGERRFARLRHVLTMRFRSDITGGWRIETASGVLRVIACHDPSGLRALIELTCEEEQG